jgi:DNA-binding NarL/FixJ family response regulator
MPHKPKQQQRFYVINANTGTTVLEFLGEKVNDGVGLIVGVCLMQCFSAKDMRFMTELPTSESFSLQSEIEKMVKQIRFVAPRKNLTVREKQVLSGIVRGLANKEIAKEINLAERTVKFHVSNLLAKYGVPGRLALSHYALHDLKIQGGVS